MQHIRDSVSTGRKVLPRVWQPRRREAERILRTIWPSFPGIPHDPDVRRGRVPGPEHVSELGQIWESAHGDSGALSASEQNAWLLALTGGTIACDQVTSAGSADAAASLVQTAADAYFNLAIIPTVKAK